MLKNLRNMIDSFEKKREKKIRNLYETKLAAFWCLAIQPISCKQIHHKNFEYVKKTSKEKKKGFLLSWY